MFSAAVKPLIKNLTGLLEGEKAIRCSEEKLHISTWLPPVPGRAFDRYSKAQLSALAGKAVPDQATIAITEECPNLCRHCALPDTKSRAMLALSEIRDVIDQVLELGTTLVIFDGGEPLTYKNLSQAVAHVDENMAISTLFTSGYGFTVEKALKLKQAGLYAVNVSLDFPDEKRHDKMRGREGVYKEAINAIKNAVEADLFADVYVVLSPDNIDCLEEFYSLAIETGAHELTFYEIVPAGRWTGHEEETLNTGELRKLDRFVEKARRREGPRVMSIPHIMRSTGCFAGRKWIHITPKGEVLPCACIPTSFGNIRKERIEESWKKIRRHEAYCGFNQHCLMRDAGFREKYLKPGR